MNLLQYVTANPVASLVDAQGHAVTVDTKQVGSGQARNLLTTEKGAGVYAEIDVWRIFSIAAKDTNNPLFSIANTILITASDSGSYFGMDEDKADGIANRAGLAGLVATGVMTQATANKFIGKTLSVTYPFTNSTKEEFDKAKLDSLLVGNQEFTLPNSIEQKIYELTIGKSSSKKISIKIMQRFGSDASNLTEWHEANSFIGVKYPYQVYKSQVNACNAPYRELKVVSEYLLDMSVN